MLAIHTDLVAKATGVDPRQVESVGHLLDEGATIPFIARYRKEKTGSLDEVKITSIRDELARVAALEKRREAVLKSLEEQGVLTDELGKAVNAASSLPELEDIYLPYRPRRRTRATIAREKGLEPLAENIFHLKSDNPYHEALDYINPEKGVETAEEAISGARDIIAEWVSENASARRLMRRLFLQEGIIESRVARGKEEEGLKYGNYFEWQETVKKAPSHRVLAMLRGEKEGFLKIKIQPPDQKALSLLRSLFIRGSGLACEQVDIAIRDSYTRLLAPSIETDIRNLVKERSDEEALKVFARNLRNTLMAPPLGQHSVLAVDPGYRTGCKLAALNRQGELLSDAVIYIGRSERTSKEAGRIITETIERFDIEAVAIGNGTAGREAADFILSLEIPAGIPVVTVNEGGASVYSASEVAREEFPNHDITVRGAVSIGRRLQDPLAELVKIDPKAIGVGQYQHDVDQAKLKEKLDETVINCVNEVGVKVNSASQQLLTYVSGLGPALAANIIKHRKENGPFSSREELKKVPRLGAKAFELAAGFLRIDESDNPLDASAVHPESYSIVERMARDTGSTIVSLMQSEGKRNLIQPEKYTSDKFGLPTINDILAELARPGRDPRNKFESVSFNSSVRTIADLKPGMKLTGIVTNVTNFGAFVDIGVHQDGLVHISQMADTFVRNPADIAHVNQTVTVTVVDIDTKLKRISLSMRQDFSQAG
ncbi:MAG: Tex family protein [Dehalococcoidales bacterium]|nr:Tex family protein [Dehalococcoidales bacterium]MDD5121953.1 Tex family protein [Dehalococcoidales bacterium]